MKKKILTMALMSTLCIITNYEPLTQLHIPAVQISAEEMMIEIELLNDLQDELMETQPINLSQLERVPDEAISRHYQTLVSEHPSMDVEDLPQLLYLKIAEEFPELNLLTGEDYDAYFRVVDAITQQTDYQEEDLAQVDGKTLLTTYRQHMADNGNQVAPAVASLLPWLTEEVQTSNQIAETILAEKANQAPETMTEPAEGTEPETDPTGEAESAAQSEETVHSTEGDRGSQPDQADPEATPQEGETPEMSQESDVQIEGDGQEDTPVEGQQNAESDEQQQAVTEAQQAQLNEWRTAFVEQTPLSAAQVEQLTDEDLLTYTEGLTIQPETINILYYEIVENYAEEIASDIEPIKQALVQQIGIDPTALNEIPLEELLFIIDRHTDAEEQVNIATLAEELASIYAIEIPTPAMMRYSAEDLRKMLIDSTPMTPDQLEQFSDETLITTLPETVEEVDSRTIYNQLVSQYPEIFIPEAERFTQQLTEELLNEESLVTTVSITDLLWAEYQIWLQDSQENIPALADYFIETYGVKRKTQPESESESSTDESAEETSVSGESQSEESADPTSDSAETLEESTDTTSDSAKTSEALTESAEETSESLDESTESAQETEVANQLRQDLISNTPLTTEQADQLSNEALVDSSNQVETTDTATVYNQLVSEHPEVFQAQLDRIQAELANIENLDQETIQNLSHQDILWQTYQVSEQYETTETNLTTVVNTWVEQNQWVIPAEVSEFAPAPTQDESAQESSEQRPSIVTHKESGVEYHGGTTPSSETNTELTPGRQASFPDLSQESELDESSSEETSEDEDQIPATGESTSPIFYIIGGIILVGGLWLIIFGGKKKK